MTQSNLLQLAKQGDAKALAVMLNQSLKSKSITARVSRKEDCLHILLESAQIPDQQAMVSFIRNGLLKLEVESIETVKVYGRQTGEESPSWNQKFELLPQPQSPLTIEPDFNILSDQTPEETPLVSSEELPLDTEQIDLSTPKPRAATRQKPTPQAMGPMSVGNVVSAGLRIYRDHFKTYYRLAFIGYLWVLVPIYGWAKFSAMTGLLSRLAFNELIERPEAISEARRHTNSRMWSFLGAGILVGLIIFGVVLGATIVFTILGAIIGFLIGGQNTGTIVALGGLGLLVLLVFIVVYIRLLSRLFVVEVPLVIEPRVDAISAISRSWQLTKGFVGHLQWVVFVAFLITLPISLVVRLVSISLQAVLRVLLPTNSPLFGFLFLLVVIAVSLVSGAFLIPFWQAIKAVVYYDLRSRKEGLDLQIRDSIEL